MSIYELSNKYTVYSVEPATSVLTNSDVTEFGIHAWQLYSQSEKAKLPYNSLECLTKYFVLCTLFLWKEAYT